MSDARVAGVDDCVFCRILVGQVEASIVYRDDLCTGFMDVQPVNPGHVLVIPNVHAAGLADLEPSLAGHLMEVAHRLMAAIRSSGIRCEGVNLHLADGRAAGQDVFHVHLHVFPRYRGDGFGLRVGPHYGERPSRAALDDAAGRIVRALQARPEQEEHTA